MDGTGFQKAMDSRPDARCRAAETEDDMTPENEYRIERVNPTSNLALDWDRDPWAGLPAGRLAHAMGAPPEHLPETAFKALHDGSRLHLLFQVRDRYVVARHTRFQDPVCEDSCVEFFFYPGDSVTDGYFNLEVNCRGTLLFKFQRARGLLVRPVSPEDAARVGVHPSLGFGRMDPEVPGPLVWKLLVSLPLEVVGRYLPLAGSPRIWRGNVYKCADRSSHPHWLTWNPVSSPGPDFHRPEGFGRFVFL
jgi:hypothetical protein